MRPVSIFNIHFNFGIILYFPNLQKGIISQCEFKHWWFPIVESALKEMYLIETHDHPNTEKEIPNCIYSCMSCI